MWIRCVRNHKIDYHAKVEEELKEGPLVKTTVGPGYVEGAGARRHDRRDQLTTHYNTCTRGEDPW